MINGEKGLKIVVLGGGLSSERDVSIVTATSVCRALRSAGQKAVFVDSFLGIDVPAGGLSAVFDNPDGNCGSACVSVNAPDIKAFQASYGDRKNKLGPNVIEICKLADCVFIGLHGEDGEDGKIQAIFEMLGIPFTGSGFLASSKAIDKSTTRLVMQANGIKCAPLTDRPPCVVKCACGGSSIGTYICDTQAQYDAALKDVAGYGSFFAEVKIEGRELTVPVLDGKALSPIEIVPPESGQFDYVAKYQAGDMGAKEICPAQISPEITRKLQEIAERLHKALDLAVYSRTDFILAEDGTPYALEINSLPGLTPASLVPKAAAQAGLSYTELCEKIVELSLNRLRRG